MAPLTYPTRPINGGQLEHAIKHQLAGEWRSEPKYNGWRALVHAPSGTMFNRKGERLSIADEFKPALKILVALGFIWLDCEALERRHSIGRGSLIILDTPNPTLSYRQRRDALTIRASEHGIPIHEELDKPIQNNSVYLCPSFNAPFFKRNPEGSEAFAKIVNKPIQQPSHALVFYHTLKECNRSLGCEFFEGIVIKELNSKYPIQLRNPSETFPFWIKYRWAF